MATVAAPLAPAIEGRHPRIARGSRSLRFWALAASVLVLAGVAASLVAAGIVADDRASHAQLEFKGSAREVASTLQLAIQHEQDLVVSAAAFVITIPPYE